MVTLVDLYTKQELLDRIKEKEPGRLISVNVSTEELRRLYLEILSKKEEQNDSDDKTRKFQLSIDWKDVNFVRVFHMVEKCHAIVRDSVQESSNNRWKQFQENDFRYFVNHIDENDFVRFHEHDMILDTLASKIEKIEKIKADKALTRNEFFWFLERERKDLLEFALFYLHVCVIKDNIQFMLKKAAFQSCLFLISFYTILVESFDEDYKNETESMITKVKEGISL